MYAFETTIPGKSLEDFVNAVRNIATRLTGETAPGEQRDMAPIVETRHPSGDLAFIEVPTTKTTFWRVSDGQGVKLQPTQRYGKTRFTVCETDNGVKIYANHTGDWLCSALSRVFSELHLQWPELAYSAVLRSAQLDAMAIETDADSQQVEQTVGVPEKLPARATGPQGGTLDRVQGTDEAAPTPLAEGAGTPAPEQPTAASKSPGEEAAAQTELEVPDEEALLACIPDGRNRTIVRLWRQGYTYSQIANELEYTEQYVKNLVTMLRKNHGEETVPYHRK